MASAMFCSLAAFAGTDINVYHESTVSVRIANPGLKMTFKAGELKLVDETFALAKLDSIILDHYVSVHFDENTVAVSNPYDDVDIKIDGTKVTIDSKVDREVKYKFSGVSADGCVVFSSLYKAKFAIDSLQLTSKGVNPPFHVLTKKSIDVTLNGTTNLLNSEADTAGATVRSHGQLIFNGDGNLNVTSVKGHAIQSSDYVAVRSGNLKLDAASDGIHVNDYYLQSGGDVDIVCKSDGLDIGEGYAEITGGKFVVKSSAVEARGIRTAIDPVKKNNADVKVSGGYVDIQLSGKGARGFKSEGNVNVSGGDVVIIMSGETYINAKDTTSTCGIKADSALVVEDGNLFVICQSKALSSRCVQADLSAYFNGGTSVLHQNCGTKVDGGKKPSALKTDGDVVVAEPRNLWIFATKGSKGINIDGGKILINNVEYFNDSESDNYVYSKIQANPLNNNLWDTIELKFDK